MNRNTLFTVIAVIVGFLIGWLIFGVSSKEPIANGNDHDHTGETITEMWTCSMHPQIMQPEPGDCPICGMELIPMESSKDGLAVNEIKMTKNAMALANVSTSIVGAGTQDVENSISLSGKIKMNEAANAIQASYFDGRIEQLKIDYEGQEVRVGQLLATIYSPELVAAQQELITALSLKESQPSLYKAVRNKLKSWKLSEEQIQAIEISGEVREIFPIYANVSGTVAQKMASEGDYVKKGQPILKVSDLNSVWAEFDAYENQIAQFKEGQTLTIIANAYPNKKFDAKVSFIDPVLNSLTRTVTVRATLNNKDGLLKPGMFIKGNIRLKEKESTQSFTIPASAVMWTGERSVVYIKTNPNEPIFKMQEIILGNRNGETYQVVSGLNIGDEVVTNGTFTVDAAAQLQGKQSMMNQGAMEESSAKPATMMKMVFPKSFQDKFKAVLDEYLKMKDAFVESNAKEVSNFAKVILEKIKLLPQSELGEMEKSHITVIVQKLEAISNIESLEKQRANFVALNENMVPIVKNLNGLTEQLFIQKCPMANNNEGAFWMSTEREIRNPYYGEQMMTCGSIIDSVNYEL